MEGSSDAVEKNLADISKKFQKYRKSGKMTQEEVASAAGISRSSLARFESGRHNPTLEGLLKIADAMGYRVEIRFVKKGSAPRD